MYDNYMDLSLVPSIKEIKKMDYDEGKELVTFLYENHNQKALERHFKVSKPTFVRFFEYFGITIPRKTSTKSQPKKKYDINSFPSYQAFKFLSVDKRYEIIMDMSSKFTLQAISNYWNVSISTITKIKANLATVIKLNDSAQENETNTVINQVALTSISDEEVASNQEDVTVKEPLESQNIENINNPDYSLLKNEIERISASLDDVCSIIKSYKDADKDHSKDNTPSAGLNISLNNTYKKSELNAILSGLTAILDENKSYKVNITISE